jgi:hypothetical protein
MAKAEALLSSMAIKTAQHLHQRHKLQNTVLLFDNGHKENLQETAQYQVRTARPVYQNSDDLLVKWAQENQQGFGKSDQDQSLASKDQVDPARSLFVTSDRELITRLNATGARLMKPKEFFRLVHGIA